MTLIPSLPRRAARHAAVWPTPAPSYHLCIASMNAAGRTTRTNLLRRSRAWCTGRNGFLAGVAGGRCCVSLPDRRRPRDTHSRKGTRPLACDRESRRAVQLVRVPLAASCQGAFESCDPMFIFRPIFFSFSVGPFTRLCCLGIALARRWRRRWHLPRTCCWSASSLPSALETPPQPCCRVSPHLEAVVGCG